MRRPGTIARILVLAAAAYSAAAVISFVRFLGPFESGRVGILALFLAFVIAPYVPLYLAVHFRGARPSTFNAIVVTICAVIAGWGYALSFGPVDGEYALIYYVVPIIQLPLAVVALTVTLWKQPKPGSSHAT